MISVGIFTGYYPYTIDETIEKVKNDGMNCVQLDLDFKDIDLSQGNITKEKANVVRDKFRDANIPIVAISAYTNLVHPDFKKREKNINYVKEILSHARDFGTPYVVSETGTYNVESDWLYDPKNSTEEAYQEFKKIALEIAEYAYANDAVFLVENYVNNIVGTVDQVVRFFREVNHPGIALLMDPTNYFNDSNIDDVDPTIYQMFNALEDKIRVAHAKDCRRTENTGEKFGGGATEHNSFRGAGAVELPAAGLGVLNYDLYLTELKKAHPNIPIIIEHLEEEDIPRAKKYVDDTLKRVGA